jgi:putative methionine-R-sulfoxide reductase with GAF domain
VLPAVLADLARLASEDLDLHAMQQRITDALAREFDWEFVALNAVDRERGRFVVEAMTTTLPTSAFIGYSRELGSGVVGQVAASGRTLLIGEAAEFLGFVQTRPGARSELAVAIRHHGEVIGVLNVESLRPHAFDGQQALLETIATQIAGAIHGARRHAELQRRASLLEVVSQVARSALDDLPQEVLLHRVLALLAARYTAIEATVLLESGLKGHLEVAAHIGGSSPSTLRGKLWPIERGVVGRCFRTGEPQRIGDVERDPDYTAVNPAVRAELAVPIRGRERVFGVLNLEADNPAAFDELNRLLLRTLADQIGTAIELALAQRRLAHSEAVRTRQEERLRQTQDGLRRASARAAGKPGIDLATGLPGGDLLLARIQARLRRVQRDRRDAVLMLAMPGPGGPPPAEWARCLQSVPELRRALAGRWAEGGVALLVDGSGVDALLATPWQVAEATGLRLALGVVRSDRDLELDSALRLLALSLAGAGDALQVDLSSLTRPRPRRGRPAKTAAPA